MTVLVVSNEVTFMRFLTWVYSNDKPENRQLIMYLAPIVKSLVKETEFTSNTNGKFCYHARRRMPTYQEDRRMLAVDAAGLLPSAFNWSSTVEGSSYWLEVYSYLMQGKFKEGSKQEYNKANDKERFW